MYKSRLFLASACLFLAACSSQNPPVSHSRVTSLPVSPTSASLAETVGLSASVAPRKETFTFVLDLRPAGFRTQIADVSEVKFFKLSIVGEGITETLRPDGADADGLIPVVNGQATATLSNIPIRPGKLRIVTAQGYGANRFPLENFISKGFYYSNEDRPQVSVEVSRSRLLTAQALEKILQQNPARAEALNLQQLQDTVNLALGFNPLTGKFLTDPTLFDPGVLANMLLNGTFPTAESLTQQAKITPGNATFRFLTPRGGAIGEELVFRGRDPLSTPITLPVGTLNGSLSNMQVVPGEWNFSAIRLNKDTAYSQPVRIFSGAATYDIQLLGIVEVPVITNVSTLSGSIGTSVTISGGGFDPIANRNTVRFGSTVANVTAATHSSLTVTVPFGAPVGLQNLRVEVDGQLSNIQTFTVRPGLTAISPNADVIGSSISLSGGGFDLTPANNTVKFGTTTATVTAANAFGLTVTVPAGISGTQAVTVTAGGQTSDSKNFDVLPAVSSLSTSSGLIGSSITLTGTGFDTTPANNTVRFGSTLATVTAATATSLTVTVPAGISGTQDVTVQVGNQTSPNTAADNFAITPTLTSLGASSGTIGSSITLTGTGFSTTPANNTVKFGTTTATVTAATATSLTVTVPAGISGIQNVTVQVGTQTNSGTNNFAITPAIASLSAVTGVTGDSLTLNGTGFDAGTLANNTVKFGTTTATVTAATATTLTVTLPNAIAGVQNATVQVGAQTSAASAFTLLPKITVLSTAAGQLSGKTALIRREILTVSGTGFDLNTAANNTVKFGAISVAASGFSGTDLLVTIPVALVTGDISVSVDVNSQSSAGMTATVPVVAANLTGGFY